RGCARGRASRAGRSSVYRCRNREPRADDLHERPLGARDLLVAVAELAEHPAGQDRLEGAVEDEARQPRVELAPELAGGLPALDDPRDRVEDLAEGVEPPLELGAAADLAHEHADQVGIAAPRAEHDRRHLPELLPR